MKTEPEADSRRREEAEVGGRPVATPATASHKAGGIPFLLRWLISGTVRQAVDLRRQVRKFFHHQRDILSTEQVSKLESAMEDLRKLIATGSDKKALNDGMTALEKAANETLRPYPSATMRDNVEVILVAVAVAMGIRTFFLQPFKIPTGSMQPTLYGVHFEELSNASEDTVPNLPTRFLHAVFGGTFYHVIKAENDGVIVEVGPRRPILFINTQAVTLRYRGEGGEYDKSYRVWFSPEDGHGGDLGGNGISGFVNTENPDGRFALHSGRAFRKGEYVVRIKDIAGDHVFVDRVTYNFRHPRRGETIVFETRSIRHPEVPTNQFYIKRMVAKDGERVRLGNDRRLIIDGTRLDASTPRFENVYYLDPSKPPQNNQYSGHVNELVGRMNRRPYLAPNFPDETAEFQVRPGHYMVMGDNTMNSLDSRAWGDFPQEDVMGKACFVYWPIWAKDNNRFGWAIH